MHYFNSSATSTRLARHALAVVLAAVPLARAAQAQQPVMREQDIDEHAVTRALTPEEGSEPIVTRGFVLKQPGPAPRPAGASATPSVQILITFASNSTTLTNNARSALDKVAHAMQSEKLSAYRFRIEGHADPRGAADANMKLSADRAAAVVDYLTQNDGISAERLSSVGKGSSEPLNRRDPAAPENRRVTIVTVKD